ncbi:hypothetical protein MIDIC_70054 [Alphaproteobacteria bacterium]
MFGKGQSLFFRKIQEAEPCCKKVSELGYICYGKIVITHHDAV